ncbi:MAG: hydratase [Hyphomicrobiales bacterium]|nr:hydratase [Hyphomicrobiales bacterium]
MREEQAEAVAREVLEALEAGRQIEPFSVRRPSFTAREAYAVTKALRRLRVDGGAAPIGRKIGFTNRGIWSEYGVYEPIWGDVYDTTASEVPPDGVIRASHLSEPKIEPEIVFGLAHDLHSGMDERSILDAIGWVAHGFEIVQSVFPGWRFAVADCIAAGGLHGALVVGPRRPVHADERDRLFMALPAFSIALHRNETEIDAGKGANVLNGPLSALKHLVEVLGNDDLNPPLRAGEMVTTGTLTRAFPIVAGEKWSTTLSGIDLPGLAVTIG